MNFASFNIRDQLGHSLPHCSCSFQFGQWIGTFGYRTELAPATDPAQLRGLVRVGVKKAQTACGSSRLAGFPCLSPSFATIFSSLGIHIENLQ
jgi:hypothetical protein